MTASDAPAFELHYSSALIRRAVRSFVRWRLLGFEPRLMIAGAVLLACAGVLAAGGSRSIATILTFVAFAPVLLGLVGWAAHLVYKLRTLRAMGRPIAFLTVMANGLLFRSGAREILLPFEGVMAWRERPGFWLLLTTPNSFIILPTSHLPVAFLADFRARLQAIAASR